MQRVPRDRHAFVFAADVEPVLEVDAGEEIVFETLDSWAGRLQQPEDIHRLKPDYTRSNPAAGPVFVRGAEPGDALAVDILSITPHSPVISKITGFGGVLAGDIGAPHCRFVPVEDGHLCFWDGVRIPLRPMIGCIATAPATGRLTTADPGDHGSNMDHNDIQPGRAALLARWRARGPLRSRRRPRLDGRRRGLGRRGWTATPTCASAWAWSRAPRPRVR